MGVGEVEELLQREERREKKRKARLAKRTERREKAQRLWRSASETLHISSRRDELQHRHAGRPLNGPAEPGEDTTAPHTYPPESVADSTIVQSSWYYRLAETPPLRSVCSFISMLRHAHIAAAHVQAIERVERRQQAYGNEADNARDTGTVVGWGLGSFGIRERERGRRAADADRDDEASVMSADERSVNERVPKPPPASGWSMWWWGPLRRWRLQDSTAY